MNHIKCPKCSSKLMPTTIGYQIGRVDCPVCGAKVSIAHASAAAEISALHARGKRAAGTPIQLDGLSAGDEFDIQWMPPGVQSPIAFVSNEPRQLNFTVKPEHAQIFNDQLQKLIDLAKAGNGDLPFIDFNHEDGAASGRPTQFYWGGDDPKRGGIRLKGTWTNSGKAAVTGSAPEFTRFSPEWYFDDTDEPIAIGANLGGLVNRAAFKGIATVTAKDGSDLMVGKAQAGDFVAKAEQLHKQGCESSLALAQARKINPAAATAYDLEKATLDRHPFMNRARALAAERAINLESAVAQLARADFSFYQAYLSACGKFSTKVTVARGKAGQDRFFKAVEVAKAKGMSHDRAMIHIAETRPDLYEEFRKAH